MKKQLIRAALLVIVVLSNAVIVAEENSAAPNESRQVERYKLPAATIRAEEKFSMAQRKYMEGLRWLLGIVRSPQEIVRVCEQKQPQNSRSYGEALSNWKHVNKAIIDFIEQRWLLVTGLRSEGNIVLQAAMERSLNGFVAEQVARGFFKDGQDTCSNLANYFESDYFNMRSSFHSSWMPLVAAPAPAQIESWYKE